MPLIAIFSLICLIPALHSEESDGNPFISDLIEEKEILKRMEQELGIGSNFDSSKETSDESRKEPIKKQFREAYFASLIVGKKKVEGRLIPPTNQLEMWDLPDLDDPPTVMIPFSQISEIQFVLADKTDTAVRCNITTTSGKVSSYCKIESWIALSYIDTNDTFQHVYNSCLVQSCEMEKPEITLLISAKD